MAEKLTKSDVEKIEAEIEHRKLVVRKEALEALKEARSHGDLSKKSSTESLWCVRRLWRM